MTRPEPASLPHSFQDVDTAATGPILRCLDRVADLPGGRAYKDRAFDLLGLTPAAVALDVACGTGCDVARMGTACRRAVGVDRSRTLIAEATRRHPGSEFLVADADGLPFADDTFDAVRVDRALQHIANPRRVVAEMARVARRGGVVLCAEPDWGTFLMGGRCGPVPDRVTHDWIRRFRNPWIGRELMDHLAAAGVADRHQEGVWLETSGFADTELLFEVEANVQRLRSELPEADEWLANYRRSDAYAGVLMLTAWGQKI